MRENKYSLRYLHTFEEDLNEIIDYIAFRLNNPTGALRLLEKIETSIMERVNCPEAFEPFPSTRMRKNPYYRIYVDNFTVYYVVIGSVMEVRRVLYSRRDTGML